MVALLVDYLMYTLIKICYQFNNSYTSNLHKPDENSVIKKFCNILVTRGTVWQFWMLLIRLWRWRIHTRLWEAKIVWYALCASRWICLYGLENGLGIHSFRPTWSGLIVELLATRAKFLQPSGPCTVINWALTVRTKNVFGCFCGVWIRKA